MNNLQKTGNGLKYSLYVIFHPFNGFWELKREKKGDLKSASVILFCLVIVYILRRQLTGFILNYNIASEINIVTQVTQVVLPLLLWCISNWGITELVDGEGTFRDIFITSVYALVPIIIINIPMLIMSNVMSLQEVVFYTIFDRISIGWAALLMVTGIMTIHQFSMKKTLLTIIIALLGMVVMLFLFLLFFAVIQQFINFIMLIYTEMLMRL